ncbi:hypothetical protein U27_05037 [Candidatus Vecturithrix granuli]|uniref:Protein-glutamine gamma-glutamyltransferase-like C-terminal domain-containing protein n=1 Tax=Vecturithrix granuli TaxID=1499967 RepID=A0A081C0F9_VECG1|nr:hypothetical protein U27_05037 [Candidatus Vecturithrix granuli]
MMPLQTQSSTATLKILLLAGMVLLIFMVLASTLSSVELAPGDSSLLQQLLQRLKPQAEDEQMTSPIGSMLVLGILRFMILFMIIGLPFAAIYFVISPEFRRQVMRQSVRAGMLLVGLYLIIRLRLLHSLDKLWDHSLADREINADAAQILKALDALSTDPPRWIILLSSFLLALLLSAGILWGIQFLRRRGQPAPEIAFEELADVVQSAIVTYHTGGSFKNVIIRCYVEMSAAVEKYRGIQRQDTMTPREFEMQLTQIGFPPEPIRYLTRMFEVVRYGTQIPGEAEEQQTMYSLAAIINACQQHS